MAVMLGGPLLWYLFRCRVWHQFRPLLATLVPGLVIMCLMFLPWMWYMGKLFPHAAEVFATQTVGRAAGTARWSDKLPGYYMLWLLNWVLPWVAFAPAALVVPFIRRFRKDSDGLMYLMCWVFGLLLVFTACRRFPRCVC